MKTNFNEYIAKFSYFAKWIVYFLPFHILNYLIRVIFKYEYICIPRNSIGLNNTKLKLIKFKL